MIKNRDLKKLIKDVNKELSEYISDLIRRTNYLKDINERDIFIVNEGEDVFYDIVGIFDKYLQELLYVKVLSSRKYTKPWTRYKLHILEEEMKMFIDLFYSSVILNDFMKFLSMHSEIALLEFDFIDTTEKIKQRTKDEFLSTVEKVLKVQEYKRSDFSLRIETYSFLFGTVVGGIITLILGMMD